MTTPETLEAKIQACGGNPALMLRREATPPYLIPLPEECSNWRDEQKAWNTAILYDQSFHMFDTYFKGPDVKRLFSDYAVNDFTKFGANKGQTVRGGQQRRKVHR
jgi:vanillate/3-O-methylgallate O-demethylase